MNLGITDYLLLTITLVTSLGIGGYFAVIGWDSKLKDEYLLGSRQFTALPVAMSMFATFSSAISLLGLPAEVYTYGTMVFYDGMGQTLAFIVGLYTMIPLLYPLQITSVYEYLERRFKSRVMRLTGTVFAIIQLTSYMTIALLSPGLALQKVGIPLWFSIILIGAVGTFYTAIGGFKAVIWIDVFQTCVIFLGIVVIFIKGSVDVGGLGHVMDITSRNGRLVFNDFSVDPRVRHSVWGLIIGGFIYWSNANFVQTCVQRIVSLKTEKDAKNVFLLSIPTSLIYGLLTLFIGLVIVTYIYSTECDPLSAGNITNPNQLMPYFVMKTMSLTPGIHGLFLAAVFSATLSTLSSGINSLAAVTLEDLLGKVLASEDEDFIMGFTKLIACAYGIAIILLAYLVREFSGSATQLTYAVIGTTAGPILGLFVLGATFPQANAQGAVLGSTLSLILSVWITTGSFFYGTGTPPLEPGSTDRCSRNNSSSNWTVPNLNSANMVTSNLTAILTTASSTDHQPSSTFLYDLSYVWISPIGLVLTLAFGLTFSFIYRASGMEKFYHLVEPNLLFPWARQFWGLEPPNQTN